MVERLNILTWDDPRGIGPLAELAEAFARTPEGRGVRVEWSVQPLEGFESGSLERLAREHDLLIIDHPHCGDALAADCLRIIHEVPDEFVGPCRESYRCGEGWLAAPVDAACHVCAVREGAMEKLPATWEEVLELARGGRVAIPLRGVHALMAVCTLLAQNGTPLAADEEWPAEDFTAWGLELLRSLVRRGGSGEMLRWNPIQALRAMVEGRIDYLPLTFGYAYFQREGVRFDLPPARSANERGKGGILGGTGLAISKSCRRPELAEALARFAASGCVQAGLWARHGQPAHRSAWGRLAERDAFYRDTRAAMENSYVRPRCAGWNAFQTAAGNLINHGLAEGRPARELAAELRRRWRSARDVQ